MKLRSPGGVLNSFRIRFFGGIPNVTAWPDVPLAMSQGTFDGLISSNESVNSAKLFDSGLRYSLQDNRAWGFTCRWSIRISGRRWGRSCRKR